MKKLLLISLLVAAAIVGTSISASAQEWVDIEFDKEYKFEKGTSFYGRYTAKEDGALTVWGDYIESHLLLDKTFMIGSLPESGITLIQPAEGSYIAPSGSAQMLVEFSDITFLEKVTMSANGESVVIASDKCNYINSAIYIDFKEDLLALLESGKVKRDDEITFTLEGVRVRGKLFNETGVVTVRYISAGMPIQLVSVDAPEEFLSYFPPDTSDAEGTVVFNFSGEVGSAKVYLMVCTSMGVEDGSDLYYHENDTPYTIEGNKVIIDLRGRSRRTADMFPGCPDYNPDCAVITLAGVVDKKGLVAYKPGNTTYANFSKNMDYRQLENDDTAVEELFGDKGETLDVYTADGVKVLENGNADDVKALAKGLYIINGRKVILR